MDLDKLEKTVYDKLDKDTLQANAIRSVGWSIFYLGAILREALIPTASISERLENANRLRGRDE